ncbi:MAG: hypothetical protein HON42_00390 [Alphaproteobacteria bacterium]|nr:hypothetical protein [Alphaproteobacteria bacterium]
MLISALLLELKQKMEQCKINAERPRPRDITSTMMAGKIVGLVGYGRIAKEVKDRLVPWDCKEFLAMNRHPELISDPEINVATIEEIFERADIISIHLPFNPSTAKLVDYRLLSLTKKGFFLVNTSRGGVVCEKSLLKAIHEKKVLGAAIDVFAKEPLELNHPLRLEKNVILTNHIIGHTKELFDSLAVGIKASIAQILEGKIPDNCVNRKDIKI